MVVTFKEFDEEAYKACIESYGNETHPNDFITVYEGEVIQTFVVNNRIKFLVLDSMTKNFLEVESTKCTVVER